MFNKKKGYDYFSTLVKMSQLALEEARLLKQIVENYDPDKLDENRQKMHAIEHDCDTLKHELSTELVKDFNNKVYIGIFGIKIFGKPISFVCKIA